MSYSSITTVSAAQGQSIKRRARQNVTRILVLKIRARNYRLRSKLKFALVKQSDSRGIKKKRGGVLRLRSATCKSGSKSTHALLIQEKTTAISDEWNAKEKAN